jgi:hypothetical protein
MRVFTETESFIQLEHAPTSEGAHKKNESRRAAAAVWSEKPKKTVVTEALSFLIPNRLRVSSFQIWGRGWWLLGGFKLRKNSGMVLGDPWAPVLL